MSKDGYLLRTPIPMNYPGMVPMHSVNLSVLAYNGTRDNRVFVDKDNNTVYKLYDSTYGFVPTQTLHMFRHSSITTNTKEYGTRTKLL